MTLPDSSHSAAFGRKSESYEAHAHVQRNAAAWLAEWLPEDSPARCCIEFGAGTGILTEHLQARFAHVLATDVEGKMVAKCRLRVPNVAHEVRDAWAPQNDGSTWDCIVSSSLLQWVDNPVEVLQHWRRLLRENSCVLLGFFVEPSLQEMMQVIRGRGPVEWRSPEQWNEIFVEAGFNVVRIESDTRRYDYENPLHLWKSLHGTGATVSQRLQSSQMLRFFRDYERHFKTENGVYATWAFCRAELRPESA